MNDLIFVFLIISLLFINGCILNQTYVGNTSLWSEAQVDAYFSRAGDIFQLAINLNADGYQWQSDGTNISYLTDTFATPAFFLSHGGGNCGDWQEIFWQYYLKHPGNVTNYVRWVTRQGYFWHYFTTFEINGQVYMQTNNDIILVESVENAKDIWYNKGWRYFDVIQD